MLHPSICQMNFGKVQKIWDSSKFFEPGQNLLDKQLDLVPWVQLDVTMARNSRCFITYS